MEVAYVPRAAKLVLSSGCWNQACGLARCVEVSNVNPPSRLPTRPKGPRWFVKDHLTNYDIYTWMFDVRIAREAVSILFSFYKIYLPQQPVEVPNTANPPKLILVSRHDGSLVHLLLTHVGSTKVLRPPIWCHRVVVGTKRVAWRNVLKYQMSTHLRACQLGQRAPLVCQELSSNSECDS